MNETQGFWYFVVSCFLEQLIDFLVCLLEICNKGLNVDDSEKGLHPYVGKKIHFALSEIRFLLDHITK